MKDPKYAIDYKHIIYGYPIISNNLAQQQFFLS